MGPDGSDLAGGLSADRGRLDRVGTAERVADLLRDRIVEGFFPPGARLAEEPIVAALGVSRNTLREAFRLLCHERLAVHEFNRGVFVRLLSVHDVADLYRLRRIVECAAVRDLPEADPAVLLDIEAAVNAGHQSAQADDWRGAGTADLHFHQAIAAITGSPRVNDLVRRILAELRLAFAVMPDPRSFHEPYLRRNQLIYEMLTAGDVIGAEAELIDYLDTAQRQLAAAFEAASPDDRSVEPVNTSPVVLA